MGSTKGSDSARAGSSSARAGSDSARGSPSLAGKIAQLRIARRQPGTHATDAVVKAEPITSWAKSLSVKRHFAVTASARGVVRPRALGKRQPHSAAENGAPPHPAVNIPYLKSLPSLDSQGDSFSKRPPTPVANASPPIDDRIGSLLLKKQTAWSEQVTIWDARMKARAGEPGVRRPELYAALRVIGLDATDEELDRMFDGHEREDAGGVGLRFLDLNAVQRTLNAMKHVHTINSARGSARNGGSLGSARIDAVVHQSDKRTLSRENSFSRSHSPLHARTSQTST